MDNNQNNYNPQQSTIQTNDSNPISSRPGKGFKITAIILIIILLLTNLTTGYLLYSNSIESNKLKNEISDLNTKNSSSSDINKQLQPADAQANVLSVDKFVVVGQEDGSTKLVSPDQITSNQDQIGILKALRNYCRNTNNDFIVINNKLFDDASTFLIKDDRARISAGQCLDNSEEGGGAAIHFLFKNSQGEWQYHLSTQESPMCERLDGWVYPKEIIPDCFDNNEIRTPR